MANHGQLTFLTAQARTDFAAGLGKIHCELVKISWPSPDGVIWYAWENWLADSVYATPLGTLLAGDPLVVAFAASPKENRFHDITRTSSIGDDVVSMTFANTNRTIETLIRTHGSGVKVEFFWFFPNVDSGTAVSWFLGYLRTPSGHGAINKDWVQLTAASGQRTANMTLPNLSHPQQCPVRFGGQMTAAELALGHPCTYNRHLSGAEQAALGGAKGSLDSGSVAFTDCPHTLAGCTTRGLGDAVYMGVIPVTETVPVGAGEHRTYSTTHGRYGTLHEPSSVVYGEREVTGVLLDYRKEVNPSSSHPEAGTLVTLFEFGLGPVESMTDFQLMERTPQGIDSRLGTQEQTATVFAPSVPRLNRRALANLNQNPIDPSLVQVEQMKATCTMQGRNTVRVYTAQDTYTETYTANRAWALLDLLENTWYGLRLDRSRLLVSDFIYLAGKQSTFNCQVTGRSAQQQISDICESANWFLPFNYNGQMRFLPMEELDTTASDIPIFTDTGATRNIVVNNGISSLTVAYKDDDEIPNRVILQFDDAEHHNITRPLVFEDWTAQQHAGDVYGDNTKRVVEKTYAAYGVTDLSEAAALGATFRDIGIRGQGGLANNLEITFVTRPALFADALELHENKYIKVVSDKLTGYNDPNGDPFQYFLIKSLRRTSEADLVVVAQAYGAAFYASSCAPSSGYVEWTGSSIAINGPNGNDTKLLTASPTLSAASTTYSSTIDPNDVITSRWVHTIDALPPANSYNVWHGTANIGFKVWYDGSGWIYHQAGIDTTTFTAGTLGATDTLTVEYDKNGGTPLRYFKHNGTTVRTDSTSVVALNEIDAVGFVTDGMTIGDIFWEVFPCGCTPIPKGSLQLDGGLEAVFISEDWTIWPKTFSVWVRADAYPASDGTIMALETGGNFRLGVDSTGHLFFSSGATTDSSSGTLDLNTWYHVAIVAASGSSASRKVYLNGVEVISSSGNDTSIGTPSSVQFYLGNDNGSLNGLECTLAAFHAWDAELTASEVLSDYEANCYEARVVTGSIRYWFPMHTYVGGMTDGSGNGILGSQSGTYLTDFPSDIMWCTDECTNTQEPGTGGGTTIVGTDNPDAPALIGEPVIGETLVG